MDEEIIEFLIRQLIRKICIYILSECDAVHRSKIDYIGPVICIRIEGIGHAITVLTRLGALE